VCWKIFKYYSFFNSQQLLNVKHILNYLSYRLRQRESCLLNLWAMYCFLLNLWVYTALISVSGPLSKSVKAHKNRLAGLWLRGQSLGHFSYGAPLACVPILARTYKIMPPLGLRARAKLWGSQAKIKRTITETARVELRDSVHWMRTKPGIYWSHIVLICSLSIMTRATNYVLCSSLKLLSYNGSTRHCRLCYVKQSITIVVKVKDLNNQKTLKICVYKVCFSSKNCSYTVQNNLNSTSLHLNLNSGIKFDFKVHYKFNSEWCTNLY